MDELRDPRDLDVLGEAEEGEPLPVPKRRRAWRLVVSPAAVAVASIILALSSLGQQQDATELGDVAYFGSKHPSELTVFRTSSAFRVGVAGIALLLAIVAAVWVRRWVAAQEETEDGRGTSWVPPAVGAAVIVSLVGVAGAVLTLVRALETHATRIPFGG